MSVLAPKFVRVTTTPYTAKYGETLLVDASGGNRVINLPPPSVGLAPIIIKKTDATANLVNITPASPALIDNSALRSLNIRNDMLHMAGDGTNWIVIAGRARAASAPTIGTATAGDASASVAFTAPTNNGGSDITSYTATSTPGNFTGTGTSSPITVTGLTNGTTYTFRVHATNAEGNSPQSAASNSVTPAPPPTAGASDNFNRADENPLGTSSGGQTWVHPNPAKFRLVANKAVASVASGQIAFSYVEDLLLVNKTITVDVTFAGPGGEAGLIFRIGDTSNYWRLRAYGGSFMLQKTVAGVKTDVGGILSAPDTAGTYAWKIVITGDNIQTYIDNVLKHNVTDAALNSNTKSGLFTGIATPDTTTTYDNFSVVA